MSNSAGPGRHGPALSDLVSMNIPDVERGHVLITGASTGIGRACALYLSKMGFTVWAGVRKQIDGEKLEDDGGGRVKAIKLDITDAGSIAATAEQVGAAAGEQGLCGLVNNAGIVVAGPIEFLPLDQWRRQFEVNLFGQIAMTQAMLPSLRKHVVTRGRGAARIVMMSSIAGKMAQPIVSPYSSSKFALEAVSDALRLEVRPQGIHVSIIEPGAIETPIWGKGQLAAQGIEADAPGREIYGPMIDGVLARTRKAERSAVPAERVAQAVGECLTRRRPKIRILVGSDARLGALVRRLLPDRWFDAVIERALRSKA